MFTTLYSKCSRKIVLADLVNLLLFFVVTASIHFYFTHPVDHDTAYHFAVGKLIAKYGVLHSFPWTQFSTQLDNYADKEFLFHLLFVPLKNLELIEASRIIGILSGSVMLGTVYLILRFERVPFAAIWTIVPVVSSDFLLRFAQVRPHLLSLTLAFILIWAIARERIILAAVVSALYPLCYVAFWQIPLIIIVSVELARFCSYKKVCWKLAAVSGVCILIGLLLHPNSFNLLKINWTHMVDVLFGNAWGKAKVVNIGTEFYPYSLVEWAKYLSVAVIMSLTALGIAYKKRHDDHFPLAVALAALVFGLLTVESRRFVEYFIPLATVALALTVSLKQYKYVAHAALIVSAGFFLVFGAPTIRGAKEKASFNTIDPEFGNVLRASIPEKAQVFTTGWHYTGDLMLALPERRFLVAGEPTLMYKKDPKLYYWWYSLPSDAFLNPAQIIRAVFRSRFVISESIPAYWDFFETLKKDPAVKQLHSGTWVLFDLGP